MTTPSDPAEKISRWQWVFSILVLGTFLTVSFGGVALKHGQRYRFLGRELYAGVLEGERYCLLKEYQYINNYHEPRRLFILEEAGSRATHNRVILTDEHYQTIAQLEFPKPGVCSTISLVKTINPPLLEMVSHTSHGQQSLHYTIREDQFFPFKTRRPLFQTASLIR